LLDLLVDIDLKRRSDLYGDREAISDGGCELSDVDSTVHIDGDRFAGGKSYCALTFQDLVLHRAVARRPRVGFDPVYT
jgi:hypothetical protein